MNSPKGRRFEVENRAYAGISFCRGGRITYELDGKKFVSDREHVMLLPVGKSYVLYTNESGVFPLVNFTPKVPFDMVSLPTAKSDIYIKEYERLERLMLRKENKALCMSILYGILDGIAKESAVKQSALSPAVQMIEEGFADKSISCSELAKACRMSDAGFRRKFEKSYGAPPAKYVLELKISAAKQRLALSSESVTEISEECGFSSVYHFCRAFKASVGMTPTEYRQQNFIEY